MTLEGEWVNRYTTYQNSFVGWTAMYCKYTKLYFTDHTENVHKHLQICFICFHNHQKTENWVVNNRKMPLL
jgi:hypothetical protein